MLAGVPSSAGQCRFVRVISVLIFPGAPELCWFCVAQERTGHPRSQRSAEQAFTLDAGRVTVASALGQLSICAYLLLARTHRQPVIDGRSQGVTHGMGVREQITARNADYSPLRRRGRSPIRSRRTAGYGGLARQPRTSAAPVLGRCVRRMNAFAGLCTS
jgi:hypothetical protein